MRPNEATMEAPKPTLAAVLEKENLNRAWEGVRANKGAPGPDGRDIASSQAHMRENWENIEAKLGNDPASKTREGLCKRKTRKWKKCKAGMRGDMTASSRKMPWRSLRAAGKSKRLPEIWASRIGH